MHLRGTCTLDTTNSTCNDGRIRTHLRCAPSLSCPAQQLKCFPDLSHGDPHRLQLTQHLQLPCPNRWTLGHCQSLTGAKRKFLSGQFGHHRAWSMVAGFLTVSLPAHVHTFTSERSVKQAHDRAACEMTGDTSGWAETSPVSWFCGYCCWDRPPVPRLIAFVQVPL